MLSTDREPRLSSAKRRISVNFTQTEDDSLRYIYRFTGLYMRGKDISKNSQATLSFYRVVLMNRFKEKTIVIAHLENMQ